MAKIKKMKNLTTTIFSNGVHLQTVKCIINRKKQWRWVVVGFEDKSFLNGEALNPVEYAEKQQDLIQKFECD